MRLLRKNHRLHIHTNKNRRPRLNRKPILVPTTHPTSRTRKNSILRNLLPKTTRESLRHQKRTRNQETKRRNRETTNQNKRQTINTLKTTSHYSSIVSKYCAYCSAVSNLPLSFLKSAKLTLANQPFPYGS